MTDARQDPAWAPATAASLARLEALEARVRELEAERRRVFEDAQREADAVFAQYQLSQLLASGDALEPLADAVLAEIGRATGAGAAALWLAPPGGGPLELAATVGSAFTDLPDAPLAITGPGEESGTYDFFVEKVIAPIAETQGLPEDEWQTRPDYTASPNDNVIVEGIEGSDTSLGWVGFAFYQEEQGRMKAIEVDGGDGCVAPTPETIADGTYPISRPLFIYVDVAEAQENPAVAAFVDYYLSDEGIANVTDVGYVAEPAADLEAARSAWSSAVGG